MRNIAVADEKVSVDGRTVQRALLIFHRIQYLMTRLTT